MATSNDGWVDISPEEFKQHVASPPAIQPQVPQAAPGRGALKYADAVSDALPATGALVGGAVATPFAVAGAVPTMGASSLLIPAGGAGGYGLGEFLKRYLDKATSRPGEAPAVTPQHVLESSGRGAAEAMNAFSVGKYLEHGNTALSRAMPMAERMAGQPTAYAPLASEGFDFIRQNMKPGRDIIMAPPSGDPATNIGGKYATPRVDSARMIGSQALQRGGNVAAEDAAMFQKGMRAERAIPHIEGNMRADDQLIGQKSGVALDKIREAIGPYPVKTPGQPPVLVGANGSPIGGTPGGVKMMPPGEDVVNSAFRDPTSQNRILRDPVIRAAMADVKSPGLRNKVGGKILGKAHFDFMNADAAGLGDAVGPQRGIDADTMLGLAKSLQKQRGGISQGSPDRGGLTKQLYNDTKQAFLGPQSRVGGLRAETPENAILQNSRRQMELESDRRGLLPVDPGARDVAMRGVPRPFFGKDALPDTNSTVGGLRGPQPKGYAEPDRFVSNPRTMTRGALYESIWRMLHGDDQNQ